MKINKNKSNFCCVCYFCKTRKGQEFGERTVSHNRCEGFFL